MTLNEYQEATSRTYGGKNGNWELELATLALGAAGEAGEAADYVKKVIGHGHPMDRSELAKELGDALWYLARLAAHIGFDLETVAQWNIDKLAKRYPAGFSREASLARVDVEGQ